MARFTRKQKTAAGIILLGVIATFFIVHIGKSTPTPQVNIQYTDVLSNAWQYYKKTYIQADGRVIDVTSPNLQSTSEGQSYAMLQAVQEQDHDYFDRVYQWTLSNLAVRHDGLFAWLWGRKPDGSWGVIQENGGMNSATDGDEQTAVALINAYNTWKEQKYLTEAMSLMKSIYASDTASYNNQKYVVAGNWANDSIANPEPILFINPSYLQLTDYRLFSRYDNADNWNGIINTSFDVLNNCTFDSSNIAMLPPNWCLINTDRFNINYTNPSFPPVYSYDAFRTMYNVALDYKIYKDPRDLSYLQKTSNSLYKFYQQNSSGEAYNILTDQTISGGSYIISSGTAANFYFTHPNEADSVFMDNIYRQYESESGKFGNGYYDSNWNWFMTYLYSNQVENNIPVV